MQLPIFVSKIVSKHFLKYRYSHHMLNDLKIKSLKPREELYRVADHSGLCIEIRPSGSKFWRYRYRFLTKAKMLTIQSKVNFLRVRTNCLMAPKPLK